MNIYIYEDLRFLDKEIKFSDKLMSHSETGSTGQILHD